MNNFKEKSQVFIIGVMVGLIIAGGFFILKLDNYFTELNVYKNVARTFSYNFKKNEVAVKSMDPAAEKEISQEENKIKNKKTVMETEEKKTDFILNPDTLNIHLNEDSVTAEVNNTDDDIVIRKDELLFTKTLEAINLSPVASTVNSKDSLLVKVSGINDDRQNAKHFFNLEFWQSPLNYKGYKMSKNKVVLYGLTFADGIKLFKLEDAIYLKNALVVYRLEYAGDFKPYERVIDETIISKLK